MAEGEVIEYQRASEGAVAVPVATILARVRAIKELVSNAFVENVHYGVIPYTNNKKVLLQSGADLICSMFGISPRFHVEALGSEDVIRYRVTCQGVSRAGEILGEGLGEASTDEEKYKWRRAVCDEEWESTPHTHRRTEYKKSKGDGFYTVNQIRTEPADAANTILKMAAKRAKVAMVLTVTGCSDDFTQDEDAVIQAADDSPEATVDKTPRSKSAKAIEKKAAAPAAGAMVGERKWIENKVQETGADLAKLLADAGITSLDGLTPDAFAKIKAALTT